MFLVESMLQLEQVRFIIEEQHRGGGDMEDAQWSYNHEEVKALNISMGNEEIESSGHIDNIEPLELVETMTSLKMEV
jgi:hypothetical protein